MEIKWIEDFIALAQYQSFSRAAEFRNVTQSGFSRRIQSLEQWVGADLINRSSFPPTLTPAGQLFREAAEDILEKLFDTRAIIRTEQRIAGKGVQIAAGHTIALNFLPAWLRTLAAHFDEVRARVIPANVHDSILMLVNGNCDLMFAYHHPELSLHLDPTRYEYLTVGSTRSCRSASPISEALPHSGCLARTTVLYHSSPTPKPAISDVASRCCSAMRIRLPPCIFITNRTCRKW